MVWLVRVIDICLFSTRYTTLLLFSGWKSGKAKISLMILSIASLGNGLAICIGLTWVAIVLVRHGIARAGTSWCFYSRTKLRFKMAIGNWDGKMGRVGLSGRPCVHWLRVRKRDMDRLQEPSSEEVRVNFFLLFVSCFDGERASVERVLWSFCGIWEERRRRWWTWSIYLSESQKKQKQKEPVFRIEKLL